jgi:hypothetical protein
MITILVADPHCLVIDNPHGVWIASGLGLAHRVALCSRPTPGQAARICQQIGDAAVIHVSLHEGVATSLQAWRGITAAFEIFYALRPNGLILVSDSFRNILAQMPVEERVATDEAVLDHFLFRTVPGEDTYCRAIRRVGHGDHLTIQLATPSAQTAPFHRIARAHRQGSLGEYLQRIEVGLAEGVARVDEMPNVTSLFSGGIDSTLIETYRKQRKDLVVYLPELLRPGTPDPCAYASRASKLMDLKLVVRPLPGSVVWDLIERNIANAGWPQRVIQNAMYADAFKDDAQGYVLGIRGDALFGADGTRAAVLASRLGSALSPLRMAGLPLAAALLPQPWSARTAGLLRVAKALDLPVTSPHAIAAESTSRGFSDYALVAGQVGFEALHARLENRLDYVAKRLAPDPRPTTPLARHLEMAHWIDYWCEDNPSFIRQLAYAHGKAAHMPFLAYPLVDQAMSIPAVERYHRGFEIKYLLKRLLARRLPGYRVHQHKGITAAELPPKFEGQSRVAIWERFPMPDFIPRTRRDRIEQFLSPLSFSALALAMMRKHVLGNPTLSELAGTRRFIFPDHADVSSADHVERRRAS